METHSQGVKGVTLEEGATFTIAEGFPYNRYFIKKKELTGEDEQIIEALAHGLNRSMRQADWSNNLPATLDKRFLTMFKTKVLTTSDTLELVEKLPRKEDWEKISGLLREVLSGFYQGGGDIDYMVTRILDEGIGYGFLGPLIRNEQLEEIMVNGAERNVFVYHAHHGMCKTDIMVSPHDETIRRIISKAAKFAGRKFNEHEPLLDARLPDGSRLNATYESVTPFGHSITIRKFTTEVFSLVELIARGTISAEAAAFIWVMVEGMNATPMNTIITGGSGCGKTTLLNALARVIPYRERIITIEDTTELQFDKRENWIAMESQPQMGDNRGTTMDELLKNAMRMRPDRIILGEVRGEEAQTMFVAMDTGHQGILGTLHSNTAREMMVRLTTEPMNVPQSLLHMIELVIVLQKVHDTKVGMKRRVYQIAEVSHLDKDVLLSNVFERNPETDTLLRTDTPSHLLQVLSELSGQSKQRISKEIMVREKLLEWMLKRNIRDAYGVEKIAQQYYFDPASVLEEVNKDL